MKITAATQGFTPRRLKPFSWSWFALKIVGAPLTAGLLAFIFIGFTNAGMLHVTMESGQLVHEYDRLLTPEETQAWVCQQIAADPEAAARLAEYDLEHCQ